MVTLMARVGEERLINALLMFAAVGVGFGGAPWVAFAIGATLIALLGLPRQIEILKRYQSQPVTDIVLGMAFEVTLAIVGTFASAWTGYGVRLLLLR
jgi:hypothetical protein